MNGYLKESNFMMVEEGFTTRHLLENLLVELHQAVRAGSSTAPRQPAPLGRGGGGEVTAAHSAFLLERPASLLPGRPRGHREETPAIPEGLAPCETLLPG